MGMILLAFGLVVASLTAFVVFLARNPLEVQHNPALFTARPSRSPFSVGGQAPKGFTVAANGRPVTFAVLPNESSTFTVDPQD